MNTTVIIVQTLGAYFIISGLFLIFRQKTLVMMLHELSKNRVLTYVVGIFISITGAALILGNVVRDSVTQFIEIISWLILIKGLIYIFFPAVLKSFIKPFNRITFFLGGLTALAVGIYLVFFLS